MASSLGSISETALRDVENHILGTNAGSLMPACGAGRRPHGPCPYFTSRRITLWCPHRVTVRTSSRGSEARKEAVTYWTGPVGGRNPDGGRSPLLVVRAFSGTHSP